MLLFNSVAFSFGGQEKTYYGELRHDASGEGVQRCYGVYGRNI